MNRNSNSLPPDVSERDLPLLVCIAEVSRLTSLSAQTIWRLASCGQIPRPIRIGAAGSGVATGSLIGLRTVA